MSTMEYENDQRGYDGETDSLSLAASDMHAFSHAP